MSKAKTAECHLPEKHRGCHANGHLDMGQTQKWGGVKVVYGFGLFVVKYIYIFVCVYL